MKSSEANFSSAVIQFHRTPFSHSDEPILSHMRDHCVNCILFMSIDPEIRAAARCFRELFGIYRTGT
jgi:hypothetical protein